MTAGIGEVVERRVAGRYRLLEQLGAGAYGTVWRALDEILDVTVAAKEVRIPATATPSVTSYLVTRVIREARMVARLRDQPNVVTVLDVVEEDALPWIIMEYVPGVSLAEAIRTRGAFPAGEVARIGAALLEALIAAHRLRITHRDVKPANILLGHDDRIVLVDFGVAVHVSDPTITDGPIGTLAYIAPEQFAGVRQLAASDLFSLGATLYHAVEGVSPFFRPTEAATVQAVLNDEPVLVRASGPLAAVIRGLLGKESDRRLSAEAALVILRSATEPQGTEPQGTEPQGTEARGRASAPGPGGEEPGGDGPVGPVATLPAVSERFGESRLRRAVGAGLAAASLAAAAGPWALVAAGDQPAWIGAPAAVWSCLFAGWAAALGYLYCRPDTLLLDESALRYRRAGEQHVLTRDQVIGARVRAGRLELDLANPAEATRYAGRSEPPYLDPSDVLVLCHLADLADADAVAAAVRRRFGDARATARLRSHPHEQG